MPDSENHMYTYM